MTDEPTEMPDVVANIHNATIANIEFAKKQQWAITNYAALVLAGLFGLSTILQSITAREKVALSGIAVLTVASAIALLLQIQRDTARSRRRLEAIHTHWMSAEHRSLLAIRPYVAPAWRGANFLAALIGALVIGGGIVVYSLLRQA